MTTYEIKLSGCDDSTSFAMELTDTEAGLMQRVAARSKETSEYECQPTMTVRALTPEDMDEVTA